MKIRKNIFYYVIAIIFFTTLIPKGKYDAATCSAYAQQRLSPTGLPIDEILFVPGIDDVKMILLGLIHAEQKTISIAMFRLTDAHIAEALIQAHHRGVKIRIIIDWGAIDSMAQKISLLLNAGLKIQAYYHGPYSIMHHKFFIFGKNLHQRPLLWYGSSNATVGGTIRNCEAVHVWGQRKTLELFRQEFKKLTESPWMTLLTKSSHELPFLELDQLFDTLQPS